MNIKSNQDEEWKDVVGYEGLYQVSNMGRFKSLPRKFVLKERIFLGHPTNGGHLSATFSKNGKSTTYLAHRIVAKHFVDGYFDGAQVNHINYIRDDNKAENLEWVTPKQNCAHSKIHLITYRGEAHPLSVLKNEDVSLIKKLLKDGMNKAEIGRAFGVSDVTIGKIAREEIKSWIKI